MVRLPMEVRPDFVRFAGPEGVALRAAGFEEGSTFVDVTCLSGQVSFCSHSQGDVHLENTASFQITRLGVTTS